MLGRRQMLIARQGPTDDQFLIQIRPRPVPSSEWNRRRIGTLSEEEEGEEEVAAAAVKMLKNLVKSCLPCFPLLQFHRFAGSHTQPLARQRQIKCNKL